MFFFLKCAFWILLVFYCVAAPSQKAEMAQATSKATGDIGQVAADARALAVEKATAACMKDPEGCMALAQRVSSVNATLGKQTPPADQRATSEKISEKTQEKAQAKGSEKAAIKHDASAVAHKNPSAATPPKKLD